MPEQLLNVLIYAGIVLLSLVVIGVILTRLYRRATKDVALIRTGFGGEKVVLNGGIMVIPVLHELMQVRLTTVKLEVSRLNKDALITFDKLRVDVVGLFHIKVKPDAVDRRRRADAGRFGQQPRCGAIAARWQAGFGAAFGGRDDDDGAPPRQPRRLHPEGAGSADDRSGHERLPA
jgi:uncharacterized membrane protein YqiK